MGPLVPGTVFAGDYRIVQPLSAGGMGAVYVAEQLSTRKLRAVKLMHGQLLADESFRRRFEQEARIGAQIPSEHVVEVQAAGVDAQTGLPYLVMELLEGENLEAVVRRRGALAPAEVRVVMEQVCHAVGAAHQAGIVHRDLKPLNVFMAKARRTDVAFTVKVLDFGIAKLLSERATQTAGIGSPLWLAPEQAERSHVTPATDVWALGLLAFFLLTGACFWISANAADSTITQVMREVLFDPIPSASTRAAERGCALPPGFDAWFAWCLNRDPAVRCPDAHQAFARLAPLLPHGGVLGADMGAPVGVAAELRTAYESGQLGTGSPSGANWGTGSPTGSPSGAHWGTGLSSPSGMVDSRAVSASRSAVASTQNASSLASARKGMAVGCLVAAVLAPVLGLGFGIGAYLLLRRAAPDPSAAAGLASAVPVVPESASLGSPAGEASSVPKPRPGLPPAAVADPRARAVSSRTPVLGTTNASRPAAAAPPAATPASTEVGRPGRRGKARTTVNGFDLPSDTTSVLRGLEPSMKSCYERVIARDDTPHDSESMIMRLYIGPSGTVSKIDVHIDSAPPGVGTCTLGVLRGARFSPTPKNNTAEASLIVSFSIVG